MSPSCLFYPRCRDCRLQDEGHVRRHRNLATLSQSLGVRRCLRQSELSFLDFSPIFPTLRSHRGDQNWWLRIADPTSQPIDHYWENWGCFGEKKADICLLGQCKYIQLSSQGLPKTPAPLNFSCADKQPKYRLVTNNKSYSTGIPIVSPPC
jgi:hypothetical protein